MRQTFTPLLGSVLLLGITAQLAGCATPSQTTAALVAGSSVLGITPTTNILQTYYLGAFDPQSQLPPTIYRIRVQGQSSALSTTRFASGWVLADLVDSLSGRIAMQATGPQETPAPGAAGSPSQDESSLDRRLVMFGPEGFREAPKKHRLVIVMSANPATYFESMDRALGVVAGLTQSNGSMPDVLPKLWPDLARLRQERQATERLINLARQE